MNPYQKAFASLRAKAASHSPYVGGRAEVSFIVGKDGRPRQASVFGLSPELDKALTSHLQTIRFPTEHAGQFYTSKISIIAQPPQKPTRKLTRTRSRRKRVR